MAFNVQKSLSAFASVKLIKWGYSQKFLPFFYLSAAFQSVLFLAAHRSTKLVLLGDPVLAPLGYCLKILFGCRTAVFLHGLDICFPSPMYQKLIFPFVKRVDRAIAISSPTKDLALAKGIDEKKITVVNLGVAPDRASPNTREFARAAFEKIAAVPLDNRFLVLATGRLVKRKGLLWFAENVMPELVQKQPAALLCVAGSGSEEEVIRRAVEEKGLSQSVVFLGQVTDEQLKDLYRAADVYIMPNIPVPGDFEGFGLVALEAGINALPVVASRCEGIVDAVAENETGILIEPYDARSFLEAILRLLSNSQLRVEMGETAKSRCQSYFTWDKCGQRCYEALKDFL